MILRVFRGHPPPPRARKPGRRQKPRPAPPQPVTLLLKTLKHFLPGFSRRMNRLEDPRNSEQSTYSQAHLLWKQIEAEEATHFVWLTNFALNTET